MNFIKGLFSGKASATANTSLIASSASPTKAANSLLLAHLHEVLSHGDLGEVRRLLDKDPDLIFSRDIRGSMALHMAAAGADCEMISLILAHNADVNGRDNGGAAPLHFAAYRGDIEVVKLLLANGAKVNPETEEGDTPSDWAKAAGRTDVIELLRGIR